MEEISRHGSHLRNPNAEASKMLNSGWRFVKKDPEEVAVDVAKAADKMLPPPLSDWTLDEMDLLRGYWQIRLREAQAVRASADEMGFSEAELKDPALLIKLARETLWEAHREMADGDARAKVRKIAQAIDLHLGRYQGAGL